MTLELYEDRTKGGSSHIELPFKKLSILDTLFRAMDLEDFILI